MVRKESKGRQKIKMVRIKNPNHRQVTFSKRRLGLFKKASEICTLCGVEAFIIVFSPGQKIFSFGYPDVDSLVDRFLNRDKKLTKPEGVPQGHGLRELNSQLSSISDLLEAEKNRGEMLDTMRKCSQNQYWWEMPFDKLGFDELELLSASMEDLKKNVANHAMFLENNNNFLTSSSMDNNYNNNCVGVSQHFSLKSVEAKIDGFCFPNQFNDFDSLNFF